MKDAIASLVDEQEAAAILAKQHKKEISLGLPAGWRAFQNKNNISWFYRNTDGKRFLTLISAKRISLSSNSSRCH